MKKLCTVSLFIFSFSLFTFSQITINTVAGNHSYGAGYIGDGKAATDAELNYPNAVVVDLSGNLYIADGSNNVIRKVNSSGTISTIAGYNAYGPGYSGDGGPATNAELNDPHGVMVDSHGNLYIADTYNQVIRVVNSSGVIGTLAGRYLGYGGDGGPATAAEFNEPEGLTFDILGNLYIADNANNVVRKISTAGIITTVAGNYAISFPSGGYSGDGGPATAAELKSPTGVTSDRYGNLYIADGGNNVVRKINTLGIISTYAGNHSHGYSGDGGNASAAELYNPSGVAMDTSGNLYIADTYNNVVRKVNSSGIIKTIVANHKVGYSGDGGLAIAAELYSPVGIALDRYFNLYIADVNNQVVREVSDVEVASIPPSIAGNRQLTVYPNPSSGMFTFQIKNYELGVRNLEVYNMMGQKVYNGTLNQAQGDNTINLGNKPNGIYLYRITETNGNLVGEGKLVVER